MPMDRDWAANQWPSFLVANPQGPAQTVTCDNRSKPSVIALGLTRIERITCLQKRKKLARIVPRPSQGTGIGKADGHCPRVELIAVAMSRIDYAACL